MYFWKINKLKEEIHAGSVNEFSYLLYLLVPMVLEYFLFDIYDLWSGPKEYDFWEQSSSVISAAVLIIGLLAMFYLNGGKSGNNFITKYFSIGFVGGIRYVVFTLPIVIAYLMYITFNVDPATGPSLKRIDVVVIFIWNCCLQCYIGKHIYDVRRKELACTKSRSGPV